jgi:hypothetical protein
MSNVTRTKANVRPLAGAKIRRGEAGGTIEAGEIVYLNGSSGYVAAVGTSAAAAAARGVMVAPQDAVDGDAIDVCIFGPVEGYSGMTPGALYRVSDTAGEVETYVGDHTHHKTIGYALSATILMVDPATPADPT